MNCKKIVDELPVIQAIFGSRGEAIEYCKRFQKIGEVWTLYHVAQFLYFLNRFQDVYSTLDDYVRSLVDINRLIMMASIVELLNSAKDFVTFDKWVKQKGKNCELGKKGCKIWHEYNKDHGSAEKFRTFFKDYLTKEEKIRLMKSVQFYQKKRRDFLPLFCFKGPECNVQYSYCTFDSGKEGCPAYVSKRRMDKGIKECANFLYALRSRFVHEAKLFFLPRPLPKGVGGSSWLFDYLEYKFATGACFKGTIMMELFSAQFTELVQKNLKALMINYVEKKSLKS